MSESEPRFHLRVWGARGTIPVSGESFNRYGGHTACIEVTCTNGPQIILDAGTGIRKAGEAIVSGGITDSEVHLLLSHRHSDHVIGLPHFAPLHTGEPAVILRCGNANAAAARETLNRLWSPPLFPGHPDTAGRVTFADFDMTGVTTLASDVIVENYSARHPGNAAILVVGDSDGPAIAYAPDNELGYDNDHRAIIAWRSTLAGSLRDIPVLIHDAMYTNGELSRFAGWGHSAASEATRFAMECNAGTLVLFHHHPDRSDDSIDRMVDDCRELVQKEGGTLNVSAASEGLTLAVQHHTRPHQVFQL